MAKGTVNKVIILGRLGQDPDSRTTAGGMTVVNLNVATNELGKKDPNTGKYEGPTTWHRCVLFDKTAEAAAQYLKKGSNVYLEGRIEHQKYQDKTTGQDRYSTSIICHEMQFIGGNDGQQSNQSNAQALNQPQQGFNQPQNQGQQGFNQPQQNQPRPQQTPQQNNGFDNFDPDIPF